MILDILPVLPPLLRPLQKDVHGTIILSDLSKLYLQIFNANNQVIKNIQLGNSLRFINNSQRFLQETVDSLLDNEKQKVNLTSKAKTPLKSLSHLLGGKKGRFRENLLGKRVDFSGRSVIVVGPSLTLTQCGLPYKMAIELFKPFILRQLLRLKISLTLEKSKQIFHTEKLFILNLLKIIISKHFILLNRAPTLHRLGIQAFEPILIDGYAIQLHPLVCSSLNADFDGDQVAIHIPLTFNAQIEAKTLISTPNNIISVKNGEPIIMPSQDMVIGFNYLTIALKTKNFKTFYFNNYTEIIQAYEYQQITLHSPIWIKHLKIKQQMYNEINLQFKNIKLNSSQYLLTTLGRLLINNIFFKNLII
jgi:DNA-directed RNA polymerase subunit beta'